MEDYWSCTWFNFLLQEAGLPVILIDCMIFLSQCLDVLKSIYTKNLFPRPARQQNSSLSDLICIYAIPCHKSHYMTWTCNRRM